MMPTDFLKWRTESVQKYDETERSLGDIFDVKASVALVAVTFLAGVSAQLITMQGLTPFWTQTQIMAQLVALLFLATAGALILAELWPRDYVSAPTPKEDEKWIEELKKSQTEAEMIETFLLQKLNSAVVRVERNKKLNEKKSALLSCTFKLLAGATTLVMGDLLLLAFRAAGPVLKLILKVG